MAEVRLKREGNARLALPFMCVGVLDEWSGCGGGGMTNLPARTAYGMARGRERGRGG